MKRIHALALAATLAVAAVLGVSAATKTQTLGATARHASAAAIATRAHKLDVFEAALTRALKSKTPRLPKVPAIHAVPTAAAIPAPAARATAPVTARAPLVIYRRPAPIIIHKHRLHGNEGFEAEGGDR